MIKELGNLLQDNVEITTIEITCSKDSAMKFHKELVESLIDVYTPLDPTDGIFKEFRTADNQRVIIKEAISNSSIKNLPHSPEFNGTCGIGNSVEL